MTFCLGMKLADGLVGIEVGQGTPYQIIGATGYGKPILDRTLKYSDSMRFGLKSAVWLSTRAGLARPESISPIDVVLYPARRL
jgi:putative proteasome-type protease